MAHTKKYILENYECNEQLSIDDWLFNDKNVDNFLTYVDNIYNKHQGIHIIAYTIDNRSSFWEGSSIVDCVSFIRSQSKCCLYKWHITMRNASTGKIIFTGNLGKYIFG